MMNMEATTYQCEWCSGSNDTGMSNTASELRTLLTTMDDSSVSYSYDTERIFVFNELSKAAREASGDDWDGEGAKKLDINSYYFACAMLRNIPEGVPLPEIYVDKDGEVCFEWDYGKRKVFSFSIAQDASIAYAGLYGSRKRHGIEIYIDELPEKIQMYILEAVYG